MPGGNHRVYISGRGGREAKEGRGEGGMRKSKETKKNGPGLRATMHMTFRAQRIDVWYYIDTRPITRGRFRAI